MHYRNGREAKVGDMVVGKTYNRQGLVCGTVQSITPGEDSCSTLVAFLTVRPVAGLIAQLGVVSLHGTQQHGSAGDPAVTLLDTDYTECGNLLHVDDVADVRLLDA